MDGVEHYAKVSSELFKLYEFLTQRHFPVRAPRSVFLTTEQLEKLERFPPPGGLERFSRPIDIDVSIERIMQAYEIGGDAFEMGFKKPSRDIPVIYEAVQEYIRLWVDIKLNYTSYNTASIDELRCLERVSRSLFGIYKYFRKQEEETKLAGANYTEYEIANVMLSFMQYGSGEADGLSFVSYVDKYYDQLKATDNTYGVYMNRHTYLEPERQNNITEMFKVPTQQSPVYGNFN